MGTRGLVRMPPPQPQQGLMDRVGQMMQLRGMMQGQKLTNARLRGQEQENLAHEQAQKEQATLHRLYKENGGNVRKTIAAFARAGGSMQMVSKLEADATAGEKGLAELTGTDLSNHMETADIVGSYAKAIEGLPPEQKPEAYARIREQLVQGIVPAEQLPEEYPGDQWLEIASLAAMSSKEQLDMERQRRIDATEKLTTVVIKTVDDQGNPVTRIVPNVAGSEFAAQPPQTIPTEPGSYKETYDSKGNVTGYYNPKSGKRVSLEKSMMGAQGRKVIQQVRAVAADSKLRLKQMEEALENPNAQNDVLLLFNHMGMTLGAQRNARMTQAQIMHAIKSRNVPQELLSLYLKATQGQALTPKQREQMVQLGRELHKLNLDRVKEEEDYYGAPAEGQGKTVSIIAPDGTAHDIPESQVEAAIAAGGKLRE